MYDLITRTFVRHREEGQTVHVFKTFANIFAEEGPIPDYLKGLMTRPVVVNNEKVSSSSGEKYIINTKRIESDLIEMASRSGCTGQGRMQHEVIQDWLLRYDPFTIATEVYVEDEDGNGLIDILRWIPREDKLVLQIADYKPNAHKETKASSQVFRYMKMIHSCIGIPFRDMEGVYFDNKTAYQIII